MRLSSKLRLALPAAVFAIGLATTSAASAATPTATVKPSTKLTNGKVVTVHWSGFAKPTVKHGNQYIAIVQCTVAVLSDMSQTHCDVSHPTVIGDGVTKAPAKGSATYAVATGAIGDGTCGTNAGDKNNCVIVVTGLDNTLTPVPGQGTAVPISFK